LLLLCWAESRRTIPNNRSLVTVSNRIWGEIADHDFLALVVYLEDHAVSAQTNAVDVFQ